jgi:hypothetical protein
VDFHAATSLDTVVIAQVQTQVHQRKTRGYIVNAVAAKKRYAVM